VELYKVQRLLGYKSPMMTQRCAHHYPESLRDGVEMLDQSDHYHKLSQLAQMVGQLRSPTF
jgi:hypothetical protein